MLPIHESSDSHRGAPPNKEKRGGWSARRMLLVWVPASPVPRRGGPGASPDPMVPA